MKKARIHPFVLVTCIFASLLIGFFVGRNLDSAPVQIQTVTAPPPESVPIAETQPAVYSGPVNINTATLEELMTLPGIGETYAGRIIAYREQNGPFKTVGDLIHVSGIGTKRLEAIWELVTTGG